MPRKSAIWRRQNIITYELASAAFQIGIVLASATIITGIVVLAWISGLLALAGIASPRSACSCRICCICT